MPCYDPETHDRPIRLEEKIHKLTAFLCGVLTAYEKGDEALRIHLHQNDDLSKWWENHKTQDARIEALKHKREQFGDSALTSQERGTLYFAGDVSYDA